jgi:hypothetical protein
MQALITRLMQLVLVLFLLVVVYYLGAHVWVNYNLIQQETQAVVAAVNPELDKLKMSKIDSLEFPGASMWFGVPQELRFEKGIPRNSNTPTGKQEGRIKGTYNRSTGEIAFELTQESGVITPVTCKVSKDP